MAVDRRLRLELFGGTVAQAKTVGFRAPPNAPADAKVAGLRDQFYGAIEDLEQRLSALEQRAVEAVHLDIEYDGERGLIARCGRASKVFVLPIPLYKEIYTEGSYYSINDIVSYSGSMWIAKQSGFLKKPHVANTDWRLAVKHGRDGRDAKSA